MQEKVILVVDDERSVREFVKAILHKEGLQTIEAGDGIEAFDLVQEFGRDIALLLTDIKMPRMDGVSLAESVRELFPEMPVLFISGFLDPDPRDRLLKGYSVLAKPFQPQTLVKAVRELLA
jgi:CheY-like chemotaxis protein